MYVRVHDVHLVHNVQQPHLSHAPMYSVEITNRADKEFNKLGAEAQQRVLEAMKALARDPIPEGAKQLSGNPMPDEDDDVFFRIRVGDYRVIYTIEEERLLVLVVRVRHRRDAYR